MPEELQEQQKQEQRNEMETAFSSVRERSDMQRTRSFCHTQVTSIGCTRIQGNPSGYESPTRWE